MVLRNYLSSVSSSLHLLHLLLVLSAAALVTCASTNLCDKFSNSEMKVETFAERYTWLWKDDTILVHVDIESSYVACYPTRLCNQHNKISVTEIPNNSAMITVEFGFKGELIRANKFSVVSSLSFKPRLLGQHIVFREAKYGLLFKSAVKARTKTNEVESDPVNGVSKDVAGPKASTDVNPAPSGTANPEASDTDQGSKKVENIDEDVISDDSSSPKYCLVKVKEDRLQTEIPIGSTPDACDKLLADFKIFVEDTNASIILYTENPEFAFEINSSTLDNHVVSFGDLQIVTIKSMPQPKFAGEQFLFYFAEHDINRTVRAIEKDEKIDAESSDAPSPVFITEHLHLDAASTSHDLVFMKNVEDVITYATFTHSPLVLSGFRRISLRELAKYGKYVHGRIVSLRVLSQQAPCVEGVDVTEYPSNELLGMETAYSRAFRDGSCMIEFFGLMYFIDKSKVNAESNGVEIFVKNMVPIPGERYYRLHLAVTAEIGTSMTQPSILHFVTAEASLGLPMYLFAESSISELSVFKFEISNQVVSFMLTAKQLVFVFCNDSKTEEDNANVRLDDARSDSLPTFRINDLVNLVVADTESIIQMHYFAPSEAKPIEIDILKKPSEDIKSLLLDIEKAQLITPDSVNSQVPKSELTSF